MTPHLEASPPAYVPRDPSQTVLYHAVADHLETFLASLAGDPDTRGLPAYVQRELYDRFGSALNLNLHYHVIFLEGVYLDRADQGRTPCFVTGEPPTDADIAALITKISHRVMRKLRQLGYLEAGLDAAVATGYDPLGMTPPSWPVPWRPRCSSASPLASGLDSRSGAWARALAPRASALS